MDAISAAEALREMLRFLGTPCRLIFHSEKIAGQTVLTEVWEPGYPEGVQPGDFFTWTLRRRLDLLEEYQVWYVQPSTLFIEDRAVFPNDSHETLKTSRWGARSVMARNLFTYMRDLSQYAATTIPRLSRDGRQCRRDLERAEMMEHWDIDDGFPEKDISDAESGGFSSSDWYQQPVLTETMLREHDAKFPALALGRTPDDLRSRASSAFSDSVDAWRERKNQSVARLHGVYSGISHAFYLDGAELRTTQCLLEHVWVPQKLHIANNSPRDFEMIMARRQEMHWAVNVYPFSSTHFINHDVVRSFVSDVVHPASLFGWLVVEAVIPGVNEAFDQNFISEQVNASFEHQGVHPSQSMFEHDCSVTDAAGQDVPAFRQGGSLEEVTFPLSISATHRVRIQEKDSAFSLVYLDYTNNIHRQVDLAALPGFLVKGILAVCCPAFVAGIPVAQDRHRQTEAANMLNVGHYSVSLARDFEFAGLLKVFFEVAHLGAELCEAFIYRGRHRATHMWFAVFRVQTRRWYSGQAYIRLGAEGPELPLRALEAEMLAYITHRSIMQRPSGDVALLTRNLNISWQELRQRETMTDFPALQTLVNTVCRIVQAR
mmetsp:Transcript_47670/g.136596  ORF Transcript_47670/g.136596 Transcript_47670/m.136596 type:complete len:601 (+) Transcript_47670:73-1875(+)